MANITPNSNGPMGVDVTRVDTVPAFGVGYEFRDAESGTTFRYCKSVGVLAQYSIGKIDSGHNISIAQTAALLGTTAPLLIGVPQFSGGFTAANQYGWVAVMGAMRVNAKASTTANSLLYGSATGGYVSTTVTAPKLNNLYLTGTVGGVDASMSASANGYITTLP